MEEEERSGHSRSSALRRTVAALFYLVIGAIWLRLLAEIDAGALFTTAIDPVLLALGLTAGLLWRYGCSYAWGAILRQLGLPRVPFGDLNLTYARSWIGRYVPGKLTSFGARVYLAGPLGLDRKAVAAAYVLETSIQLLVGTVVGLGGLALSGRLAALAPGLELVAIGLATAILVLLYPPLWGFALRQIDRRRPGGAASAVIQIDLATLARVFVSILGVYAIAGAHWTWLAMAVSPEATFSLFPFFWGAFCLAGAVGTVAFFAPAGLGVRESVLFPLLSLVMPAESAIVLLVLARLAEALTDLGYWALSELQGRRRPGAGSSASRVIAICPHGIGNLVMTLPALASLRAALPGHEIHLVSLLPSTTAALRDFPGLPALYDALHEVRMPRDARTLATSTRAILALRRLRADTSIVCFPSFSFHYNLLSFLCRADQRIGSVFDDSRLRDLYWLNDTRVAVRSGLHDIEQNLLLVEEASGAPAGTRDLTSLQAEFSSVRAPTLGIHPGCKREDGHKQWGIERFIEVIRAVLERDDVWRIQIFLGPDELELLPRFEAEAWGDRVELVHGLSLVALLTELEWCSVFLSNDSGLMHLAVLTGCPNVIGIAGPSDPTRTGPADPRAEVLRSSLPCSPCHHSYSIASRRFHCELEPPRQCLTEITVERVLGSVMAAMRGTTYHTHEQADGPVEVSGPSSSADRPAIPRE